MYFPHLSRRSVSGDCEKRSGKRLGSADSALIVSVKSVSGAGESPAVSAEAKPPSFAV
jgi:hypothetical protein